MASNKDLSLLTYRKQYPPQALKLKDGRKLTFRHHKAENPKGVIVMLPGVIGYADLYYLYVETLAPDFTVLTVDYDDAFPTVDDYVDALAALLRTLKLDHCWMLCQSLGGDVALVLAQKHPEFIEGFLFIDCCALKPPSDDEATKFITDMYDNNGRMKGMLAITPTFLVRTGAKTKFMEGAKGLSVQEHGIFDATCSHLLDSMTKDDMIHFLDFTDSLQNNMNMTKEDFAAWDGKSLIIETEDPTFSPACKQTLVDVMTNPKVLHFPNDGVMTCFVQPDVYVPPIIDFVMGKQPS